MERISCDVMVLGGGPGGYVAAIRASQLGLDTVLVERAVAGGTCLNVGCIPSKALIHAADEFALMTSVASGTHGVPGLSVSSPTIEFGETIRWKDGIVGRLCGGVTQLLKRAGVNTINGHGTMVDGKNCHIDTDSGAVTVAAKNIILATGSAPIELAALPFGENVISSTEALALKSVPQKLAVVGGGYIGLELGMAFAKLGSTVTVIEAEAQVLSQYESELVAPVQRMLDRLGVSVLTNARAEAADNARVSVSIDGEGQRDVAFDKLLVTVGRRPITTGCGFEDLALDMDGAFVKVNERCETSMTRVFAVGDVTGEPMLAHRAMAQGDVAARVIAGQNRVFSPVSIPAVVFTDPEIVTAGMSASDAKDAGLDVLVTDFPLAANGRALTLGASDGLVRIVSRRDNNVVVGVAATGRHVSELSAVFSLALEMGACLEDIAATIHAHPTQSEGLPEAAMKALGEGVHF